MICVVQIAAVSIDASLILSGPSQWKSSVLLFCSFVGSACYDSTADLRGK